MEDGIVFDENFRTEIVGQLYEAPHPVQRDESSNLATDGQDQTLRGSGMENTITPALLEHGGLKSTLLVEATSRSIPNEAHTPSEIPKRCPYGCNGNFARPSEYLQHMKKHGGHAHFCTQPGCSSSFYRADKLRDHLWQKQRIETRVRSGSSRHD